MKRKTVPFASLLIALASCIPAFSMIVEHPAGRPVSAPRDWPELASLLNSPQRVYGYSGMRGSSFFYAGDTGDFNEFLAQYAGLKRTALTLVLDSGRENESKWLESKKVRYDWRVDLVPRSRPADQKKRQYTVTVRARLGGQVELDKMTVPINVQVKSGGKTEKSSEIVKLIVAHEARRKAAGNTEKTSLPTGSGDASEEHESEKPLPTTPEAKPLVPATYRSNRPLYGKLALTEDGSKVLSVVFDESGGTRTGYDLLYADVNFNGTFEEAERLTAVDVKRYGSWISTASFTAVNFDVPYNKKAEGIPNPCQVSLGYRQYPRAGVAEDFSVTMKIKVLEEATRWEYSVSGSVKPSKRLEDADVWTPPAPRMQIATQPDKPKSGHLGIALEVSAGEGEFECRKKGLPIEAHVEIRRPDGEVVHQGDATPDKFRFG